MLFLHAFLLYFLNLFIYSAIQPQVCNKVSVQCSVFTVNIVVVVVLASSVAVFGVVLLQVEIGGVILLVV